MRRRVHGARRSTTRQRTSPDDFISVCQHAHIPKRHCGLKTLIRMFHLLKLRGLRSTAGARRFLLAVFSTTSDESNLMQNSQALNLAALILLMPPAVAGVDNITTEAPMAVGDSLATDNGFDVQALFTVSETIGGYQPTGLLDGVGVFPLSPTRSLITVNHELNPGNGYPYVLRTGTVLTGARVSSFVIERTVDAQENVSTSIIRAGKAFNLIYDRTGTVVTDPAQINETGNAMDGLARLCSAQSVLAGTYNFEDNIFLTNEETTVPFHPHGGSVWALDVAKGHLWAVPAIGRGGWENVTPLDTGDPSKVALLCGDDTAGAPLYLYVGDKNRHW